MSHSPRARIAFVSEVFPSPLFPLSRGGPFLLKRRAAYPRT